MKQTTNFNEYNIVGDDSSLTINNSSGSLVSFTNGNLGIGTISPTEKFEVKDGYILSNGSSTFHGFELARDNFSTYQIKHLDGGLTIFNLNAARKEMTFKGNGRIGINNSSPIETLDVNGNIKADGILKLYDITDTQKISLNPDGDSYVNGNVGIGTTTPNSKLDVYGAISLSGKISLRHNINEQSWYIGELAGQNSNSYRSNAFGYNTSKNNTGDAYSDAFGSYALENNTAGYSNGFGAFALQNNTGVYSNAFGFQALQNNTGANSNGFGGSSLGNNSGRQTNGFGRLTLRNNSGILNTALGDEAGYETSTLAGSYNTFLGANASYGTATTISNSTAVGANVTLTDSNTVILGNGANVGIGTTTPTDKLDVSGNIKSSGYITGKRCGAAGYLAAPVNITVTTANTYYPIGVFTVPVAADFIVGTTYPNGLKYTGTIAQTFHITWNATIESASNNVTAIIDIQKNGVSIPMAKMGTYSKTGGEIYNLSGQCVVDLDTNDEVRFVVTADNNGEVLTFDYFAASIKEFFD